MAYLLKIGIIFVLSVFFGEIAGRFKLPRLIGYIIGGFLLGPSLLDFLDKEFLISSKFLKEFSLAFILFVIGTKIRGERLKHIGKGLLWVPFYEILLVLAIFSIVFSFLIGNFLYALLIGIVATATAPAATAMITEEYHSEGPFTDAILFTVGVDNLVVILLFNILAPVILQITGVSHLEGVFFGVVISVLLGIFTGIGVSYIESRTYNARDGILFLISFGAFFTGLGITSALGGYTLIYAIFTGITLSNSSLRNYEALKELSYIKTPIYILFFFIAGASLHIDTLKEMRGLVVLYILLRTVGKVAGAYIGARKGKLNTIFKRYTGTGLLTHAGLATGLAFFIGDNGGEVGYRIMNIILAGTVVFEILGPILLKWTLLRAGEVKVLHIMKKSMEPILDTDFQSVLSELTASFGLKRFLTKQLPETTRIKHIMRKNFIYLSPGDHIDEIVKSFEKSHFNAIPVISQDNRFHGMIHIKELETLFLDEVTKKLIVAEDMTVQFPTVSAEDGLLPALKTMREKGLDCLPVVEGDTLIGIVTRKDIVTGIA